MSAVLELAWARPLGLAALVLPLLLLLLALRRVRATPRATGTLFLWRGAAPAGDRRRRGRPRPATWLHAAALACGACALAGPRPGGDGAPLVFHVEVDHSPSTGLPPPGGEGTTRVAAAARAAAAWLADEARAGDRVLWRSAAREVLELRPGELPPPAWLEPPREPVPEPAWASLDTRATLWVSDAPPAVEPRRAGLFSSGAEALAGAVGAEGRVRLDWDGERLRRVPEGVAPRRVALGPGAPQGAAVPAPLERVFRAWAGARGFALGGREDGPPALVLAAAPAAQTPLAPVAVGRDGWRARGLAAVGGLPPPGGGGRGAEPWLVAAPGSAGSPAGGGQDVLVDARPGRVRVALRELDEPRGDPAAFAVSWGRLFDRWTLPPPGVVPLGERLVEGPARSRGPEVRRAPPAVRRASALDAWLVLAALALALAGAGARGLTPRKP